ncbi:MAG: hypothetical protein IPP87_15325 [Ideonella sp.]|nr:hypothetical protein [Ideonella sp.]
MADPVPSYEAFFKLDTGTHTGDIRQIVVSPDGQTLITAGECTIRVWDLKTRQLLRMLLGQVADRSQEVFGDGNVRRMALSPNGLWLVALKAWSQQTSGAGDAGQVTEVQVFELATGNLQAAFRHPGLLFDLDFSPDGRLLALVGNECERRIRRAVVSVYAARDVLRGGFEPTRKPLASQAFSTGPRQDELPAAVRFIPGRRKGHGGHRLVVASQGQGPWHGPSHPPAHRPAQGRGPARRGAGLVHLWRGQEPATGPVRGNRRRHRTRHTGRQPRAGGGGRRPHAPARAAVRALPVPRPPGPVGRHRVDRVQPGFHSLFVLRQATAGRHGGRKPWSTSGCRRRPADSVQHLRPGAQGSGLARCRCGEPGRGDDFTERRGRARHAACGR